MARKRDYQRTAVYRSEGVAVRRRSLSTVEARRLIRQLSDLLSVPRPKVELRRGGTNSFYRGDGHLIRMLPWRNLNGDLRISTSSLLHEFAHVNVRSPGEDYSAHGPEFARTVASLYVLMDLDRSGAIFREYRANKVEF